MSDLGKYVKQALKLGATRARIVSARNVVIGNWVRLKCQYGCDCYNTRYTCPPYSPTPDYTRKMVKEYSRGLLIQIENIRYRGERTLRMRFKKMVAKLERTIFLDGHYKAFGMASGPCRFCAQCDMTKPCRFPEDARPAMEACGIDVYRTVRNCGFKLEVIKDLDDPCTYTGLILID